MSDYSCKKCEENFEALQKVTDEPLTECEKCGGTVEKIFNKMTFHLYGPGFYTTDNKRKYLLFYGQDIELTCIILLTKIKIFNFSPLKMC